MKVVLIGHTPDAERLVAAAARLCYAEAPPEDLLAAMTEIGRASCWERV